MLENKNLIKLIELSLDEDINTGDITTEAIINPLKMGEAVYLAKEDGILAGERFLNELFQYLNKDVVFTAIKKDGEQILRNEAFAKVTGKVKEILTIERITLNFLQRMCGIATTTRKYVDLVAGTNAKILDTRKTVPGHRILDKEAVIIGGGVNHRMGLYDSFLIKDNHISQAGGIKEAVRLAKKFRDKRNLPFKIEVETETLAEVEEALECDIDRIMLDNFAIDEMKEAVNLIENRVEVEASGGINLKNVAAVAATGVDFISIGSLTHSVKALDISLEF